MKNLFVFFTLLVAGVQANAQLSVVHTFTNGSAQGYYPNGGLVSDGTFLYGVTLYGGASDRGTIYKVNKDGTGFTAIHSFTGSPNGANPYGALVYDGTWLYGTTVTGGNFSQGTIYRIMPDGSNYSVIHTFLGGTYGESPTSGMVTDGIYLYGVTASGGINLYHGIIYRILPDGSGFTKLFDFDGPNTGKNPYRGLMIDGDDLYGMCSEGGVNDLGTLFRIQTDGTGFTKLVDFDGTGNGANPSGIPCFDGTYLYGITDYGGVVNRGTVFKVKTDGTDFSTLIDFTGIGGSAMYPHKNSMVVIGNYLYGNTDGGGMDSVGTIFKMRTDGFDFSVIADFDDITNGYGPIGPMLYDGSDLYGATHSGGSLSEGVVYKFHDISIGLEEYESLDMKVYPNPCTNTISFYAPNQITDGHLQVMDMMGHTIISLADTDLLTGEKFTLDVSSLATGNYILRLNAHHSVFVKN